MTRARDVADTQDNVGGSVPPSVAGKNAVINGGMDIWQRGTSFSISALTNTYCADRWCARRITTGMTISRQTTSDTTNLPFIQYSTRMQRNSGDTNLQPLTIAQSLESVNSIPFAGRTITLSFYARAGANYSASSNAFQIGVYTGTGTDENVQSGYTGSANPFNVNATLTTTWQRFSASGTVASNITEIGLYANYTPTGTAGTNDWVEITGVQLELGSVATPFSRAGGDIAGELAKCQRYWQQSYNAGVAGGTSGQGGFNMNTVANSIATDSNTGFQSFPVIMRTAPTVNVYGYFGGSGQVSTGNAGADLGAGTGNTQNISSRFFALYNGSGATKTTNNGQVVFHWTASAEL